MKKNLVGWCPHAVVFNNSVAIFVQAPKSSSSLTARLQISTPQSIQVPFTKPSKSSAFSSDDACIPVSIHGGQRSAQSRFHCLHVSSVCHREHSRHQVANMTDLGSVVKEQPSKSIPTPALRSVVFLLVVFLIKEKKNPSRLPPQITF